MTLLSDHFILYCESGDCRPFYLRYSVVPSTSSLKHKQSKAIITKMKKYLQNKQSYLKDDTIHIQLNNYK